MTYNISFTNKNKPEIEIDDNDIDESLGIGLFGRNRLNYGEELQENLVHILESFATDQSPLKSNIPDPLKVYGNVLSNPVEGHLWYNQTNNTLNYYNGTSWIALLNSDDITANWGLITHGNIIPKPISKLTGKTYEYSECVWIVSPYTLPSIVDTFTCETDSNALVTMQYSSGGITVNGTANYFIVGISGNTFKNTFTQAKISAGVKHALALKSDGSVVGWGDNTYGQIDIPNDLGSVYSLSAGGQQSLVLRQDGTLRGWGATSPAGINVAPSGNFYKFATAGRVNDIAIDSSLKVIEWYSGTGEILDPGDPNITNNPIKLVKAQDIVLYVLGNGTAYIYVSSQYPYSDGVTPGGDNFGLPNVPVMDGPVIGIDVCTATALAWTASNLYVWGNNDYNQNTIPPLGNIVMAATGGFAFSSDEPTLHHKTHVAVLTADGKVTCWGNNDYGQCNVPAGLSNVQAVDAGAGFTLALKNDGTIVAWGDNTYGILNVPN